jgi:Transposase DDE domain
MAQRKDSRKGIDGCKQKHPLNGETLRAAVAWAIDGRIFDDCAVHGNPKWRAADLIVLAVVWVWSGDATLTGAFGEAHRWSLQVLGRSAMGTYQGLIKALVTWTEEMLPRIWRHLHGLMCEHGDQHWRVGLWLALAVDGSRVSVPRTQANEKAFCAPNFGKGKTARYRKKKRQGMRATKKDKERMQPVKPQIWITLVWHMGLQMPWSWKSGASNSSERDHFRQMLREQNFPENTLFCAAAGFTGYDLWKTIIDGGHSFLIRVGANVTLLRKLGYVRERAGLVYFWPDKAARKQLPPLVLRLLHFKLGKCNIYLVTNVLSEKRLTNKQMIEMYQLRWGVELQFRTMKQTFGRRKLRSRTPDRALVELDWSLLGLWMIQLFAVKEQIEIGEFPEQCSASLAIHVVRTTFQRWSEHPDPNENFATRLQAAIKDDYQRKSTKQARYKPNYKDKPSAGKPIIVTATRQHKSRLIQHLQMAA